MNRKISDQLPPGVQKSRMDQVLTPRIRHGGRESIGKRKTIRPFTPNVAISIWMKSRFSKGPLSLLHRRNRSKALSLAYRYAKRFKVDLLRIAVTADGIHALIRCADKKQMSDFFRVLAGRLAIHLTGAKKGVKRFGRFWSCLVGTQMINWGKALSRIRTILVQLDEGLANEADWDEALYALLRERNSYG